MKKRNWIIGSILAGAIGITGVAQACSGYGEHSRGDHKGDRMMHVMKKLDLTKEQRQAVRNIKKESRDQMEVKRDEMFELRKALRKEANAKKYNAAKVRELADAKAKIMSDITVQRIETMNRVRKELTPEQLEKLDDIKARRFDRD
ncbi:MAG: Spy/CpxP family protein refolding chaperone [Gammaproteobacteria bacterium]|nr:Spy/CpxP family protein refolding chaperone [Gammaproteobacteria bacterium]MCW8987449.1 Spy/CpxP family protein refolding chaperone [Gammaproteobacteria bacterium]MCW9030098.1 Spy/CpxP family protein refolding chaperone [Gammaproteobacteria bacterium]